MDSFKGTKGKWEVYINPESNGFVDVRFPYYATGFIMVIGDVCKDLGKPHEGAIANALLISNAKELLILRLLLQCMEKRKVMNKY